MNETFDKQDIQDNKVISMLAYLLFFLPLIACPNSTYGKFHANQGLWIWILSVAAGVIAFLPVIGGIIRWLVSLLTLALVIYGMYSTYQGEAKELPLIGHIRLIK